MLIFSIVLLVIELFLVFVFALIAYKVYTRFVNKKKAFGIISLTILRPAGIALLCFDLWLNFFAIIWIPAIHLLWHNTISLTPASVIFSVINGIIGWGLWKLKRWGYLAGIANTIFHIFYSIFIIIKDGQPFYVDILAISPIIINIVVLCYLLLNQNVKRAFLAEKNEPKSDADISVPINS